MPKSPQRKGRDYERERSKKGLKRTPASGAFWFAKGDGIQGNFLVDCKLTTAHSWILKDLDFTIIERQAHEKGLDPAILLKTRGREYLIVDANFLKELI